VSEGGDQGWVSGRPSASRGPSGSATRYSATAYPLTLNMGLETWDLSRRECCTLGPMRTQYLDPSPLAPHNSPVHHTCSLLWSPLQGSGEEFWRYGVATAMGCNNEALFQDLYSGRCCAPLQ